MKKARVLILLLLTAAITGCRSSIGPEEESGAIVIDIPMRNESLTPQKPARADIIASLDTIRLGGTVDETLLSEVSDIKFSSDRIFVLSADVLCIFDLDGRYISTIQRKGRGPGEYQHLRDFDIVEDQNLIYALDTQAQQVIIYDFDGKYKRHFNMDCWATVDFAALPNGHMLLMNLFGSNQRGLFEADENGKNQRILYEVESDYQRLTFADKYLIHINDSVIGCMGQEDTDYIFHYQNDTLIPAYKIRTDIVMPQEYRQKVSAAQDQDLVYTKLQYWENHRYMGITLVSNSNFVFCMYDKDNDLTTRYYRSELAEPDSTLDFVPSYQYCYKERLVSVYDAETILQYEPMQKDFPEITIDSNPVLVITTLK